MAPFSPSTRAIPSPIRVTVPTSLYVYGGAGRRELLAQHLVDAGWQ